MGKPGSFAEYQAIEAVNWSTLKALRQSPAHYRHLLANPRQDTARLAAGRAAHTAILEPQRFLLDYALFEGERRAGKAWESFKEQHEGKTILKVDEYERALAVAAAVRANTVAAEYLRAGVAEQPITWTDPGTGIACKARPDFVSASKPAIVDVKTTNDVSSNRFSTTVARMGYHIQAAFYQGGQTVISGTVLPFVFIAVEQEPPHDVAVYRLDDDALYAGEVEAQRLLGLVMKCSKTKSWPGRFSDEQVLSLPRWCFDDEEDMSGSGIKFGAEEDATWGS